MRIILSLLYILFTSSVFGGHIVGGIASYKVVDIDHINKETTLDVSFRMFRDPLSGAAFFDQLASFGVYKKISEDAYEWISSAEDIQHGTIYTENVELDFISHSVERTDYNFSVTLVHGEDYLIAFQRCCRTRDLVNISDPDDTGMALVLEIFQASLLNELGSPEITKVPFGIFKSDIGFSYKLDFDKPDNTEIAFNFISPKTAGGIQDIMNGGDFGCCECVRPFPMECGPPFEDIQFAPGYNDAFPFGGSSTVILDTMTSEMSGIVSESGKFNYGIAINHSLNGELLSRQILDYTLTIFETTSIEANSIAKKLIVSPNPTKGKIKIENIVLLKSKPYYIWISNPHGQLIKKIKINSPGEIVRVDLNLEQGIYFLALLDRNIVIGSEIIMVQH